jgi:hypothetical protein
MTRLRLASSDGSPGAACGLRVIRSAASRVSIKRARTDFRPTSSTTTAISNTSRNRTGRLKSQATDTRGNPNRWPSASQATDSPCAAK